METITCTPEELAAAFTEWERRFREEPERFLSESERLPQETPESYGEACAPYFRQLIEEVSRDRQTRERALASGWTAAEEGGDGFWFHPEHGPVHEDDLAGVLDLGAPPARGSFPGRKK